MAKKTLGKSRKIKDLPQYLGDVGVYDLSRALTLKNNKYKFLVIGKSKQVSGGNFITVWVSDDEFGRMPTTKPIKMVKGDDIAAVLEDLGYNLV